MPDHPVFAAPVDECELDAIRLEECERQPCEVWTRVMGYHRPAASFNTGKRGEFEERAYFREHAS